MSSGVPILSVCRKLKADQVGNSSWHGWGLAAPTLVFNIKVYGEKLWYQWPYERQTGRGGIH